MIGSKVCKIYVAKINELMNLRVAIEISSLLLLFGFGSLFAAGPSNGDSDQAGDRLLVEFGELKQYIDDLEKSFVLSKELSNLLELEAKKSTDTNVTISMITALIGVVTLVFAIGGFRQYFLEKRWRDDLEKEQRKLEGRLDKKAEDDRQAVKLLIS